MNVVTLARRNLMRRSARTVLLVAIVGVVSCTLFAATLFLTSVTNALRVGTHRLGADILVVPRASETVAREALLSGHPTHFTMDRSVLDRVRGVEGVRGVTPQLFIQPTAFTCCYNVDVFLVGFDPQTDFTVRPWLTRNLKRDLAEDEIITGRSIPVAVGDQIPFYGTGFTVAGTMEATGMDFFDRATFMSMEAAYRMAENSAAKAVQPLPIGRDKISTVLVRIADDHPPDRVAARIERAVEGVKAIAADTVISTVRRQLAGLLRAISLVSALLWAIVLFIMGFAFSMIVNERRREIGLLRAMGAGRGQVISVLLTEAGLLAAAGGAGGVLLGLGILVSFKGLILHHLHLPYLFPAPADLALLTAGALLIALLTGLLAALLPALAAVRAEPYDAIRRAE